MLMFNLIPESNTDLRKTHCYKLLKLFHREHSPSEVPYVKVGKNIRDDFYAVVG